MSETGPRTAIRVQIAGDEYTLRAEVDEGHARRCAALVDDRMRQAAEKGSVSAKNAAMSAALDLADQLLKERSRIGDRLQGLAARIDAELGDQEPGQG